MKPLDETHIKGTIFIENIPDERVLQEADLGLQIAKDGRVWVCINGIAFLRFTPHKNKLMKKS